MTRTSQIKDVAIKEGRSGTMCFVTVRHSWATERGPALEERQDIVYRAANAARPAAAVRAEVSLPQASRQRCLALRSPLVVSLLGPDFQWPPHPL